MESTLFSTRIGRCLRLLALLIPTLIAVRVTAAPPQTELQKTAALIRLSDWIARSEVYAATAPNDSGTWLFVENRGQFGDSEGFKVMGGAYTLWLADDAIWLTVQSSITGSDVITGVNLRLKFVNANPEPTLEPFVRAETQFSYFLGDDPAQWYTDVPVWQGVRYADLYPGMDLEITGKGDQLTWRLQQQEGAMSPAALDAVQLQVEGADSVSLIEMSPGVKGLLITTTVGSVTLPLLQTAQADAITLTDLGSGIIKAPFTQQPAHVEKTLQLDDGMHSVILGGSSTDFVEDTASDRTGVYLTGYTWGSLDFPHTISTTLHSEQPDIFVTKLGPNGRGMLFGAIVSYKLHDYAHSIALGPQGNIYVAGESHHCGLTSSNLGGFVLKLSPDGKRLDYAECFTLYQDTKAQGITVDSAGYAYVVGTTYSTTIPGQQKKAFVVKLDPDGSRPDPDPYSIVFAGGAADVIARDVALNPQQAAIYVVGEMGSGGFVRRIPTTPSTTFIQKFLQGKLYAVAVDRSESVYVTGETNIPGWSAGNVFDHSYNEGESDAFVAILDFNETEPLVYMTYLGGKGADAGTDIHVDRLKEVHVVGRTNSGPDSFPLVNAFDDDNYNSEDAFFVKFDAHTTRLKFATYLGGTVYENATAITQGPDGTVYLAGHTSSSDFPLVDETYGPRGVTDVFVTALAIGPAFPWSMGLSPCECPFSCSAANCQGWKSDPINTQSGNYHYSQKDVSIPALGGPLYFERSYNTLLRDIATELGYGWTHNYAVQLFFTDTLEHRPDTVIVQGCRGSRFPFYDNGDQTFDAYPGVWATLTYSATLDRYLLRGVDQSTYVFDATGQLTEIRDSQDHALTLTYSGDDLSRVADATGQRYLDFAHDVQGRITSMTDNAGRVTGYGYSAAGDLTVVTTTLSTPAQPARWVYAYTVTHQLGEIRNPAGELVERTEYDGQGRAVRQWMAGADNPLSIEYGTIGEAGVTVTTTDPLGRQIVEIYDARNTLASRTQPGSAMRRTYDGGFNPAYTADAAGNASYTGYNAMGRPEYVEDALGNTTLADYNENSQPLAITDARAATTAYEYDGAQLTHVTDALDGEVANTYDPATGLLIQSVDHGLTTTYTYNPFGQRASIVNAQGLTTRYDYDMVGRLITTTASDGLATVNAYDDGDRLIQVTRNYTTTGGRNHLGVYNQVTSYAYDLAGRTILMTDTLGLATYNRYDDAGRLIAVTANYSASLSAHGPNNVWNQTTQYAYDDLGRQTHVTDTLNSVTFTEYDEAGRVWRVWRNYHAGQPQNWRNGTYNQMTEYGYDLSGNQTHVTDTLGHVTFTAYDPLGRAIRVTENYVAATYPDHGPHNDQNLSTAYGYDAVGNQTHVTTTLGTVTLTDYDLLNRPVTVTVLFYDQVAGPQRIFLPLVLRSGAASALSLSVSVRSATTTRNNAAPLRRIVQQVTIYDSQTGRVSRTLDALGRATVYEYDQVGRTVAVIGNFQNGSFDLAHPDEDIRQETVYDPATGRVAQTIAAANVPNARRVTLHEVDVAGRPVTVTTNYDPNVNGGHYDPAHPDLNRKQVTVYDPTTGRVAASLRIAGDVIPTIYGYDPAGRLIRTADALSGSTAIEYDILDRRIAETDAAGLRTVYSYDAAGRPITVTRNFVDGKFQSDRPDEDIIETSRYDVLGQRVSQTDALGHTTVFTYDGAGRLQAQADPLDKVTTYGYDSQSNCTHIIDPDGVATTFTYDGLNRQTSACDALKNCIMYEYDDASQLIQITAANGTATRYEYDRHGRLTAVVENYRPGEPADHQTNVRTEYTYDVHGNLVEIRDALGHVTTHGYNLAGEQVAETDALSHTIAYAYDGHGRRVSSIYPDAGGPLAVTTDYNALGWPMRVDYPAVGTLPEFKVEYAHTSLGQRAVVTDAAGTMTYAYDALYRPEEIAAPTGDVQYRYNALGQRINLIYPGGEIVTYTHDAAGRLIRVTDWEGRNVEYTYTAAGRLQRIQRPNGVTSVYEYDEAGRLRSLTHTGGAGALASYAYTLDAMGNRVQAEETISGANRVIDYTYDPLSRLTGANYSTGEDYAYQYDAVGNRTIMTDTTGVTTYTYDAANRLTAIHHPNSTTQPYTWDERGNLISDGKNTYAYNSAGQMARAVTPGGTLEYTYNADGLRVRQGADAFTWDWATSVPKLLRDDNSLYLVGHDTLGWQTGADWSYALPDALGSVRQETNAAGAVTIAREWSPYGEELGEAQNGLGYAGEWFDAGVELTYLRARWYDGATGRFTSQDAWNGDYNRPQSLNAWAYVEGNPVNFTDPGGYMRMSWQRRYLLYQIAMTGISTGLIPPVHGRADTVNYREDIFKITQEYCGEAPCSELDATLVAAAIAHQASDPIDRPFGTSWGDEFTEFLYEQGVTSRSPSIGMAQLTDGELVKLRNAGYLNDCSGNDPYDPEVAIYGMTAKLHQANDTLILYERSHGQLPPTDRMMLLAIAQNEGSSVVHAFYNADRDWDKLIRENKSVDKRETYARNLRYMALHIDWLVATGWPWPKEIDMNRWRQAAFTDVPGVDYKTDGSEVSYEE